MKHAKIELAAAWTVLGETSSIAQSAERRERDP
jgi:hypothetical protein